MRALHRHLRQLAAVQGSAGQFDQRVGNPLCVGPVVGVAALRASGSHAVISVATPTGSSSKPPRTTPSGPSAVIDNRRVAHARRSRPASASGSTVCPRVDVLAELAAVQTATVGSDELVEPVAHVRAQLLCRLSRDLCLPEANLAFTERLGGIRQPLQPMAVSVCARASPRVSRSRCASRSAVDRAPSAHQGPRASISAT